MGRKPISDQPKTDKTLRIRLTDNERAVLDAKAESVGLPTSTWARNALIALAQASQAKAAKPKRRKP